MPNHINLQFSSWVDYDGEIFLVFTSPFKSKQEQGKVRCYHLRQGRHKVFHGLRQVDL